MGNYYATGLSTDNDPKWICCDARCPYFFSNEDRRKSNETNDEYEEDERENHYTWGKRNEYE